MSITKDLTCHDSRKSFYGKAHVIEDGDRILLRSYDTIVASIKDGKLHRHWCGWSATTGRHVASFCIDNGLTAIGKAVWDKLPVECL